MTSGKGKLNKSARTPGTSSSVNNCACADTDRN